MGTAKGEKTAVAHNKVVVERYRVKLIGETPMVFQRYIDNQEHPPQELLYMDEHGDIYMPGGNILGFFTNATSGTGCAATFGAKGSKGELIRLAQSYLMVSQTSSLFCEMESTFTSAASPRAQPWITKAASASWRTQHGSTKEKTASPKRAGGRFLICRGCSNSNCI